MSELPKWNLSDLYKGQEDSQINIDKQTISTKTAIFTTAYKGNLSKVAGKEMLVAIKEYEAISTLLGKIMSYCYLLYVTDLANKELSSFLQSNKEFTHKIAADLAFFELELNDLEDDSLQKLFTSNEDLQYYKSFIDNNRKFKPYQLPEIAEQILIAKSSVAGSAWVRLYDETLASLVFKDPLNEGKEINLSATLNLLLSDDKEIRNKTAVSLKNGLLNKEELIVTVINNLIKDQAISRELRGFKQPYSSMNLGNMISDQVMETLVEAVSESYSNISHRYYKLKAKVLGFNTLKYWDRNAPMFGSNAKISFAEAEDQIKKAYYEFDPKVGDIINLFFKNNWIDAAQSPNKDSGAFCHPTIATNHPYILLNFYGNYNDITTLAHELGHGVHQYLSREVGELQAGTPLVLAETASIFGEQLMFDYLKNNTTDPIMKKFLLSNKIEGIINSVHRQIAFHLFEEKLHNLRQQKELSSEDIKKIFIETQKDCLGEAVDLQIEDGIFWSYVSHFFHAPFYVYAYGFADCLVRSLYALYKTDYPQFKEKYLSLLSKGGTITPEDAVKTFGFTLTDKNFWVNGLSLTTKLIDELESLI